MEVRVRQRSSFGENDVCVRNLDLFAQSDDEAELLGKLKQLFESRNSDLVLSIRVMDGLVSDVAMSGVNRG